MKRILKPEALRAHDVIGICAPASPAITPADIDAGVRYLERCGYRVEMGKHLYRRYGYLAGTDGERLEDFHSLFASRHVRAVVSLRGGYGSPRIVDRIDYRIIRRHPKIFVGYSDLTAIQLAMFARTGLVSFSGPMVAGGMARGLTGKAEELFWKFLTTSKPIGRMPGKLGVWNKGSATGRLLGGNLVLLSSMIGSGLMPSFRGALLFLEEIGERPYRIDRMMQQLRLGGILDEIRGIVLGRFADCHPETGKPSLSLREIFEDLLHRRSIPVITRLHHGHVRGSLTVPFGLRARISGTTSGQIEILEAGVR